MTDKQRPGHIFQVTEDYATANSGVAGQVRQLTGYLTARGWRTTLLIAGAAALPAPEGVELVHFPLRRGAQSWRYPVGLRLYLERLGPLPGTLLHLHGVWMAPQWLAARAAARRGLPAMLTAHGMLEPWLWRAGRLRHLKKLAYWHTFAYPAFRRLTVIHAITPQEREHLAPFFPGQRLEVIPNAIDLQEADRVLAEPGADPQPRRDPYLLFLGRIHPKKGLELLLEAFARARQPRPFELIIAGPEGDPAYAGRLRDRVRSLARERQVTFLGEVAGSRKWQLYREAWAFCAPSFSEVMGLVNLEAAAARVPVITTHETGLLHWEEAGGLLVHPRMEELTAALERAFSWSDRDRQERGRSLRELVARRYSWEAVGPQWLELYGELSQAG